MVKNEPEILISHEGGPLLECWLVKNGILVGLSWKVVFYSLLQTKQFQVTSYSCLLRLLTELISSCCFCTRTKVHLLLSFKDFRSWPSSTLITRWVFITCFPPYSSCHMESNQFVEGPVSLFVVNSLHSHGSTASTGYSPQALIPSPAACFLRRPSTPGQMKGRKWAMQFS